jgi:hypothetical protein
MAWVHPFAWGAIQHIPGAKLTLVHGSEKARELHGL